jgi:flagellin
MSSLLTNASAMTALQTLTQINKDLATTQDRISTGQRVSKASDNAAYWSIATTMRSDNMAMSAVQDALGLGAAQVDTAYTAMDNVKNTLDQIKAKLTTASQPDVDKSKIQAEIEQLQNDLKTYASANFSGGNWLNVQQVSTEKVVASFNRDAAGNVTLGTIDVDTSKTALFNANATQYGILEKGAALASVGGLAAASATGTAGPPATGATTTPAYASVSLDQDDVIKFDLTLNGGSATTITVDKAVVDKALGTTTGAITNAADWAKVITDAFGNAGVAVGATGDVTVSAAGVITTVATGTTSKIDIANVRSSSNGNFFDATTFDITNATAAQMTDYLQGIDGMLGKVTTAASDLGAIKTRIDSQKSFVGKLMDAVDRGVGQLVDADMEEESARLSALQVQQQLGIQSLSIANSNSQNILSLFRK